MGHYISEIIGTSYHNHKHWARIVCGNEQESLAQIYIKCRGPLVSMGHGSTGPTRVSLLTLQHWIVHHKLDSGELITFVMVTVPVVLG